MLPLRAPALWLVLGWVLIVAVCFGSLLPASGLPGLGYDKVAHLLTYLTLMLWFAGLYPRHRYPLLAMGLLVLGISLEVLQRLGGQRAFEFQDIVANGAGLVLGWWLAVRILGGWCLKLERAILK